ncbi:MAG TPA: acyl carrier protein [Candidatus Aminicenantes bacterium]|nr:acyl carrier protein [Candidatus Aminicenantes bacterium]
MRESLRAFISAPSLPLARVDSFQDDDSFLEKGILDSTGVLELVGHIEKEYGIRVEADEIIPDNLDSISKLTVFVERKTASKSSWSGSPDHLAGKPSPGLD